MNGLIVHEWLEAAGGAERVVEAMQEAFPLAGLAALWNDVPQRFETTYESWLANTRLRHHKALAMPLLPPTWRHLVPAQIDTDWILVSSHLFAHHVDVRDGAGHRIPKLVYTHTPARYIWEPSLDTRAASAVAKAACMPFKPIDRRRAQEAAAIAANSVFVQDRIRRAWHREATVIYPPVDVELISSISDWSSRVGAEEQAILRSLPNRFILGASRFVPYKRLDWVLSAAAISGIPAIIAGKGPELDSLKSVAKSISCDARFIVRPSSALLYALYQRCSAYVFPAIEDFGIMPVEAQAAGAPVVVTNRGGALESLRYGAVAPEDSIAGIVQAIGDVLDGRVVDKREEIAGAFSRNRFIRQIREWVDNETR